MQLLTLAKFPVTNNIGYRFLQHRWPILQWQEVSGTQMTVTQDDHVVYPDGIYVIYAPLGDIINYRMVNEWQIFEPRPLRIVIVRRARVIKTVAKVGPDWLVKIEFADVLAKGVSL